MNEKIRNAEDLSSFMKSTRPSAASQMAVPGHILPHSGYTLASESTIPATHHHPLANAYPMMRPSLGIPAHMPMTNLTPGKARTTPPADALGPPMFMPSLNLGTPKSASSNTTSYSKSKNNNITFSQPNSPMMASEMLPSSITNSQAAPFQLLTTSSLLYPYSIQQPQQQLSMAQSSSPQLNMNSKPSLQPGGVPVAKPTPVPAAPSTSAQSTNSSKAKAVGKSSSFGTKSGYSNSIMRPASPVARLKDGEVQPSLDGSPFFYGSGGHVYLASQGGLVMHSPMQHQSLPSVQQQSHPSMQQQSLTSLQQQQSLTSMQQQQSLTSLQQQQQQQQQQSLTSMQQQQQSQTHPSLQQQQQSLTSMQQQQSLTSMQQQQSLTSMQQQQQSLTSLQQQQSLTSMQQQQSQSHPSMQPQPQPQSTLSKLLAPTQVSKQAVDLIPGPPTLSAAPPATGSMKPAGMSTGRTNHTSADKQQLCPPAATSVGPKAAATMPLSASLLTTAGQPTTAAVLADTRVDRPPQPLVSSGGGVFLPTPFPQVTSKDRFCEPTVVNNVTTRTVVPLSGISVADFQSTHDHSTPQPSSIPIPTPPQSYSLSATSLHLPIQQAFLLSSQQGYPAMQQQQQQQQQGPVLPSSPGPGSGANGGLVAAISSSTLSPGSSSPRPRILRKRPLDGDTKMMEWQIVSTSANFMNSLSTRPGPGHVTSADPSVSGGASVSGPLSPVDLLNNGHPIIKQETMTVESLTSPRKKPRKQNVVPSDDHYATNVPNSEDSTPLLPPVPVETCNGPREEVGEKIKAKREDLLCAEQVPKPVEPRCWGQLHRSPFPINGVYQVYHRAARNHFRRHADIKHREEEHISVQDVANDLSSYPRARGWKLKHFTTQLLEMMDVEHGILSSMEKLLETVCSVSQCATSKLDEKSVEVCKELLQGNVDRSKRVISDLQDTQKSMSSVLEHRHHVIDLLNKYSSERSTCNGSVALTTSAHKSRDRT